MVVIAEIKMMRTKIILHFTIATIIKSVNSVRMKGLSLMEMEIKQPADGTTYWT